ncbi:MAG: hypothetical protein QOE10_2016 [Gaiellales bacterium]|nr:hypothetical protein [Gaiellales bacterium]
MSPSSECEARDSKRRWLLPPSGLSPAATAIASISVDLPAAFAPVRKVTRGCSSSVSKRAREGIENG